MLHKNLTHQELRKEVTPIVRRLYYRHTSARIQLFFSLETAINDTLMAVDNYKDKGSFSGYLFHTAKNIILRNCNKYIKEKGNIIDIHDHDYLSSQQTPLNEIQYKEIAKLVTEAVKSMREVEQSIFTLWFYEGMKYKDIKTLTGIGENTIKSHVNRIKKQLKIKLNNNGYGVNW